MTPNKPFVILEILILLDSLLTFQLLHRGALNHLGTLLYATRPFSGPHRFYACRGAAPG